MRVEKGALFLSRVSLRHLESLYAKEENVKAKIRLQIAILRKKGKTQEFISDVTGKPQTTVSGILRRFERLGVKAAHAVKQKGQPRRLSNAQRIALKRTVLKSPLKAELPFVIWTTKLIQHYIAMKYKVQYTLRQVNKILKQLGLTLQKARPKHIKANKKLQKEFKKNFDDELKALGHVDMRSYFWTRAPSNSNRTS